MPRKSKCVECRHWETRVDSKKGTRYCWVRKQRVITAELSSRPACRRFELPEVSGQWGP